MFVTLTPHHGTSSRKVLLQPGEIVTVGRSEWADVAVGSDTSLAPVHFKVMVDHRAAIVHHVAAGHVTYVNRQPIVTHFLSDGDLLTAGNSQFRVTIKPRTTVAGHAGDNSAATGALPGKINRLRLPHGVEYLSGEGGAPCELLRRLGNAGTVYLVVNFARAGMPAPEWIGTSPDLLGGLPEPMRGGNSLHCVPLDLTHMDRFTRLWGRDALITVAAPSDPTPHLRAHLGVFTRPSVFRRQLDDRLRFSQLVFPDSSWLLEDSNGGWQMLCMVTFMEGLVTSQGNRARPE